MIKINTNLAFQQPNVMCAASFVLAMALGCAFFSNVAAATTIASVSCSTPTASLSTGTNICSAAGSYGYADASVTSSVLLPSSANQAGEIDATSTVSAFLGGIRGITSLSTAESSADIAINFDTTGPVRNGFLELTLQQNSWDNPANGSIAESLTIGSYSVSPAGQDLMSIFIPVQLGTEFGFNFTQSITANADAATGAISDSIGADIALQAFESDGSTPVQLFDPPGSPSSAPEPTTLALVSVATLLAPIVTHRSRIHRSRIQRSRIQRSRASGDQS